MNSSSLGFNDMKIAIDIVINSGHVPNIIGLQGIGKSELVREYCKEKGYFFKEITCSLLQEGDLAMPFISEKDGEKCVSYAISNIIKEVSSFSEDGKYSILFLDEFNRASSQVQCELMNLVLQREIVGYRLSDNVRIILAMNPSSEMSGFEDTDYVVSSSDFAIMGRVNSLVMQVNLKDWIAYGSRVVNGKTVINDLILDYLRTNRNEFITKEIQGSINNTPRGWSRASDIIYSYLDSGLHSKGILTATLKGTLCDESAVNLSNYVFSVIDSKKKSGEGILEKVTRLLNSPYSSMSDEFRCLPEQEKVVLLESGMAYLDSGSYDIELYNSYIKMLSLTDTDWRFTILDKISENSDFLSDLSTFPEFCELI